MSNGISLDIDYNALAKALAPRLLEQMGPALKALVPKPDVTVGYEGLQNLLGLPSLSAVRTAVSRDDEIKRLNVSKTRSPRWRSCDVEHLLASRRGR